MDADTGAEETRRGGAEKVELHRFEYTQVHMGVQARLILYAEDSAAAESGGRAAFDRLAELDGVMSDYRRDSELAQLMQAGPGEPVRISGDLFHILQTSQRLARQSGGAFDVTIGPVVRLWREARRLQRLPSSEALSRARSRTGFDLLVLDAGDTTATLGADGMRLDLGGIAKGYAADEALAALRGRGLSRVLIEFGGDVVVGDPPPGKQEWQVTAVGADRRFGLANAAVSTSGDTEQFVEIGGTRYSHVVDPRTGTGLTDRIAVTVIARSGMLSDGLATALSVLGPQEGRRLLGQHPEVEAVFRYASD